MPAQKRRSRKPPSWAWRHRRVLLLVSFLAFTALAAAAYVMIRLPLPADKVQEQTTFLTDVSGARLASLNAGVDRVNVKLAQVPDVVQNAVLAAEDRNFFRHGGIDPVGIVRAFANDVRNRSSLQGGSTITQQYVKNYYLGSERTIWRKIREAALSIKVERKLSKREILERYLNTIYWGRGAHGVQAAAHAYFGKDVGDLSLSDAAYLAGLIRAPQLADALKSPVAANERRHRALVAMQRAHMINANDVRDVEATPINVINQVKDEPQIVGKATAGTAYFVDYVRRQLERNYGSALVFGGGLRVKTTLDLKTQKAAYDSVYGSNGGLRQDEPRGALVAVDDNGNVKAMIGGRDFDHENVNLATGYGGGGTGRQAGSTFKPFLLAEAVREGYTVESAFPAPKKIVIPRANNGKDWEVENYDDKDFGGDVNLIEATRNSINTVYAQAVVALGASKLKTMAQDAGVKSNLPTVNSLVLGTAEVSPLEMAGAFSTFANRGERVDPRTILEVQRPDGGVIFKAPAKPDRKRVMTTKQADVVNFVLRQVVERGTGTGASFSKVGSTIGKTGTTNDYGDAWFVGGTTKLTTAVWMGYPEGPAHHMDDVRGIKVSGGSLPASMFKRFMTQATRGVTLGSYPDVSDFPGKTLKGDRIPYETSTSSTAPTGSSTTRVPSSSSTTTPRTGTTFYSPPPSYETTPTDRPPRNTTSTTRKRRR